MTEIPESLRRRAEAAKAKADAERAGRQAPQEGNVTSEMQHPTKQNFPEHLHGGFNPGMSFNQTIQYRPPNAPWYVTYRKDWEGVGPVYALASMRMFESELDALRYAVELGYGVTEWRPGQTLLQAIESKESAE